MVNAQQYIENAFSINREQINLYEFTSEKEKLEGELDLKEFNRSLSQNNFSQLN